MDEAVFRDLRERFGRALDRGSSARAAADLFEVSPATGVRWAQAWRRTGAIEAGKVGGHKRCKLEPEREWLLVRITEKDVTLHELRAMLREERGVVVACDTLWRYLKRLGKTSKKDTLRHGARPSGRCPPPGALVHSPASNRSQASGVHRRDLGENQYDAHPRMGRQGQAAHRQGPARPLEDADLHRRPEAWRLPTPARTRGALPTCHRCGTFWTIHLKGGDPTRIQSLISGDSLQGCWCPPEANLQNYLRDQSSGNCLGRQFRTIQTHRGWAESSRNPTTVRRPPARGSKVTVVSS